MTGKKGDPGSSSSPSSQKPSSSDKIDDQVPSMPEGDDDNDFSETRKINYNVDKHKSQGATNMDLDQDDAAKSTSIIDSPAGALNHAKVHLPHIMSNLLVLTPIHLR